MPDLAAVAELRARARRVAQDRARAVRPRLALDRDVAREARRGPAARAPACTTRGRASRPCRADAGVWPIGPAANPANPAPSVEQVVEVARRDELGVRLAVHVDELREEELDAVVLGSPLHVVMGHLVLPPWVAPPVLAAVWSGCAETNLPIGEAPRSMCTPRVRAKCRSAMHGELLLRVRDRAERLAQLRTRQRRQRRGIDDVVGASPASICAAWWSSRMRRSRSRTPRAARRPSRRRVRPSPRPPSRRSVVLEIVIPLESAKKRARFAIGIAPPCFRSMPFAVRERAAEAERRLEVGGAAGEPPQQVGVVLRLAEHGDERRRHVERACDLAEVEGDVRADQVRAVRRLEAVRGRPRSSASPASARARCSRRRRSGRARSRSARARASRRRRSAAKYASASCAPRRR